MIFGNDLSNEIKTALSGKNIFCVTDENVFSLYQGLFDPDKTFVIKPGEDQKNLASVSAVCAYLHMRGADRHATVAAVGGGVVGDLAGFAASIYMRGVPWINIPTTLLAQCDSAVGGKTGVNLGAYKNMIGAFHFPKEIYFSAHFIKTLPPRELTCGLGEIVKTACLSPELFAFYAEKASALYQKDAAVLSETVRLCAEFKDSVVQADPYEKTGLRKTLNYGHTVGHAFEAADCHRLSHGAYVLLGMRIENHMCKEMIDPAFFAAAEQLIGAALSGENAAFDCDMAAEAAASDKKNADGGISVIAVVKPGQWREVFFTKAEFGQKLREAVEAYG